MKTVSLAVVSGGLEHISADNDQYSVFSSSSEIPICRYRKVVLTKSNALAGAVIAFTSRTLSRSVVFSWLNRTLGNVVDAQQILSAEYKFECK